MPTSRAPARRSSGRTPCATQRSVARAAPQVIVGCGASATPATECSRTGRRTPQPPGPSMRGMTSPIRSRLPQTGPTSPRKPGSDASDPLASDPAASRAATAARRREAHVALAGGDAAEIGGGGVLARLDDAAADGAGAGEVGVQVRPVAEADGALQREELLGEAAEDVEGRVLVGQEHVAPHRGVGGGDAGEVAEAGGGVVDDLLRGDPAQVVGDPDHGVGDQVRHVAGHRQHQVVVVGVHACRPAPRAPSRRRRARRARPGRCRAAGSAGTSGCRRARRSRRRGRNARCRRAGGRG